MSSGAPGRARGAARGRAPGLTEQGGPPGGGNGGGSPGSDNGRGRGGRGGLVTVLNTRPRDIRPEDVHGRGGDQVDLFTNYFRLTPRNQDSVVHSYHVSFEPEVEFIRARRSLLLEHRELFGNAYIFDGGSNIKSLNLLPDQVTTRTGTHPTSGDEIKMTITHVEEVSWGSFEMLRLYNTQMRLNFQHIGWILIMRNYYDLTSSIQIPEYQLQILTGMSTAVSNHDAGVLLNCDSVNKMLQVKTVLQFLVQFRSRGGEWKERAANFLITKTVMTRYNNRTYRIDDIDWGNNPTTYKFKRRDHDISIFDYMKEQYDITIEDQRQPLLISKPTKREISDAERRGLPEPPNRYFVPELCNITGLTDEQFENVEVKRTLTQRTQLVPMQRFNKLMEFKQKLSDNENVRREMGHWGLEFGSSLMSVPARIMPGQKILMHGMTTADAGVPFEFSKGDFSREIRSHQLKEAHNESWKNWAVIFSERDRSHVEDFINNAVRQVTGPLGISPNRPLMVALQDDRTASYVAAHRRDDVSNCSIIVSIVPHNNKDRYDAIKKLCYCDNAKFSQVVLTKTLTKKQMLMSVATKVVVQMAAKSGSIPWAVHIPTKTMMVCGYDTHHDAAQKGRSIGGFVSSLNETLSQFFSKIDYHTKREELSANIALSFEEGLRAYQKANGGRLPDKVVIYRDGVGDGNLQHVFDVEVKKIQEVLDKIAPEAKLAFIIVSKRHSTKFFHKMPQRQLHNPPPGTVVDDVVTRPNRWEFFLVSQCVRQGTVAPTHYNIIFSNTNNSANVFQILSYKLCHGYFNWMGTIRVPAPCQYAHKLAYMVGIHLHRAPHAALSNNLFYL